MRVDLHCDTLTSDNGFNGQIKLNELRAGNAFQCFAAFTEDDAAAYAAAKNLFYSTFIGDFAPVHNFAEYESALKNGATPVAFTCENIGFTVGNYATVCSLKADGVIMASLVWNDENALAYPNVRTDGRRESRGLKDRGWEALRALDSCGIIVDISHLSDGGAEEILKNRKIPTVASHSCCAAVCDDPRNLTDGQLKLLADCGGVVGINFYKKFLGGAGGFEEVAAHIKHIINIAGEDTPAFGSDWDGTPEGGISICPADMPQLTGFLRRKGLTQKQLDKLLCGNFLRVFKQVCG